MRGASEGPRDGLSPTTAGPSRLGARDAGRRPRSGPGARGWAGPPGGRVGRTARPRPTHPAGPARGPAQRWCTAPPALLAPPSVSPSCCLPPAAPPAPLAAPTSRRAPRPRQAAAIAAGVRGLSGVQAEAIEEPRSRARAPPPGFGLRLPGSGSAAVRCASPRFWFWLRSSGAAAVCRARESRQLCPQVNKM